MIELQDLTKRYGEKTAVDHLSFTVRPGIVTGFLGPNGAGKSTTMRMVLGLDTPTHGTVRIDGEPYNHMREPLHSIGALLEAKGVHPGRTAYNHLLCMAQSNGIPERRVGEVLEMVGLHEVARKRPKGFSLGMGQRLGIAGALLGDPRILMFDEPVNGLDPEGIHWIRTLMQHLAREGRTVFVSSHLMSEMAQTARALGRHRTGQAAGRHLDVAVHLEELTHPRAHPHTRARAAPGRTGRRAGCGRWPATKGRWRSRAGTRHASANWRPRTGWCCTS